MRRSSAWWRWLAKLGLNALLHRALGLRPALAMRLGRTVDTEATAAEMRACEGDDWSPLQRRARRNCENFALFQRGDWAAYAATQRAELKLQLEAGDDYHAWLVGASPGTGRNRRRPRGAKPWP